MIKYGVELGDWKTAETAAGEIVAEAQGERSVALAHYEFGIVLMDEGLNKHKDEFFARAHDAAKAQFEQFVKMQPDSPDRQRALRYISQPELARARMAPPFAVTTIDGQRISLDDLKGKVVPARFLGDLVPAVSPGSAACAGYREEVPGSALGGAEREPRHG